MNPRWREIQRGNFCSLEKLCAFLEIDFQKVTKNRTFPLNLPRRLAEKIEKGNCDDPIFRQFVPTEAERTSLGLLDAVGDCLSRKSKKCLHKYAQRVLLVTTGACAMHCRYCFRQHFDYAPFQEGFSEEIALIRKETTLREVILSGGDPLSLPDRVLGDLIMELSTIPHLKRLRFHTRFPIGIPERITEEFLALLENSSLQTWFVIHCNHPRELDSEVLTALQKVQRLGIPVCNQGVLLKGVNDSVEVLAELCEKLVDHGIVPYYLHQLDPVQGVTHFEVEEQKGRALIEKLRERLSGYAVPRYVREIAGEKSKRVCTNSKSGDQ